MNYPWNEYTVKQQSTMMFDTPSYFPHYLFFFFFLHYHIFYIASCQYYLCSLYTIHPIILSIYLPQLILLLPSYLLILTYPYYFQLSTNLSFLYTQTMIISILRFSTTLLLLYLYTPPSFHQETPFGNKHIYNCWIYI